MKRILLISLSVLATLLLVTVGTVSWLLHDQDWIKGRIQERVTDLSGRQFLIDGPIEIDFSANPVVGVQGLSLANAHWADNTEMFRIENLRASFELFSLFSDQFAVHYIEADGLAVDMVKNDQGESNWDLFPGTGDEETGKVPQGPPKKLPYRVGRLTIKDFSLSHDAPGRLDPLAFSLEELNLVKLENDQFDLSAQGLLDGLPLQVDGYLGPLNHLQLGGEMDGKLNLSLGEIQLSYQGHVEDSLTFDGIDLAVNFSGPDFAWITRELALPDFSSGKFNFDLILDSTEERSRIDLIGDLGSLDVNINGEVDELFDSNEGHVTFEVTGPDLQKLVATIGEPNLLAEPYHLKGDLSRQHGVTQVNNLTFSIGENHGQVSGQIGRWPKMLNSEFDVWLKGPDISVWGPVLRLKGLSTRDYELSGRFANKDTNVILTTTRLDVGDSYIELAGSLGEPPTMVGAALEVKAASPDLAQIRLLSELADIPAIPVAIHGNLGRNEQSIFLNKLSIGIGEDKLLVDAEIPADDYLQGSEVGARADIRNLGEFGALLGYEGLPQYPLHLQTHARVSNSGLEVDVENSTLGELAINLQAKSADLNDIKNTSVQFQLAIPSISHIPYEIEAVKLPDMPGRINGRFDYRDEFFVLSNVEGSIGETAFNIDSTLSQQPGFAGSELAFSVSGPNLKELLPLEALEHLPHPFKASGRIAKGNGSDRIDALELELGSIRANVDGTVDDLLNVSSAELTVSASGSDFSVFGPLLKRDVPADPFRLQASIKGADHFFDVEPFKASLGTSDLAGNFTLGTKEGIDFKGRLHSDLLSIAWLTAPETAQEDEKLEEIEEAPKRDRVFPDTPIPEAQFEGLEIDLEYEAGHVILDFTEWHGFDLDLLLKNQLIELETHIEGGPLGEKLDANFTFDTSGDDAKLDLNVDGDNFRLGLMAPEGQGMESTPPTDIMIHAAGHGTTWHELASSLNGRFRLHQDAGLIASAGMDLIFSDLLSELLDTLNPFSVTQPYTELQCGLIAAEMVDGQVTVEPLLYQSDQGNVDCQRWQHRSGHREDDPGFSHQGPQRHRPQCRHGRESFYQAGRQPGITHH
jgi:hypothetical protein